MQEWKITEQIAGIFRSCIFHPLFGTSFSGPAFSGMVMHFSTPLHLLVDFGEFICHVCLFVYLFKRETACAVGNYKENRIAKQKECAYCCPTHQYSSMVKNIIISFCNKSNN